MTLLENDFIACFPFNADSTGIKYMVYSESASGHHMVSCINDGRFQSQGDDP